MTRKHGLRWARVLSVVLTALLLGEGGVLFVNHRQGMPPPRLIGARLPRNQWGFEYRHSVDDGEDIVGDTIYLRLGFFWTRLEGPVGRR